MEFKIPFFDKEEKIVERRPTILDKRVAESKGQVLVNVSDYTSKGHQLPRIEAIIDRMMEVMKERGFEAEIRGQIFKSPSDNHFYLIEADSKKGGLLVEIPMKIERNELCFTFTDKATFTVLYHNNVTDSVKLAGVV